MNIVNKLTLRHIKTHKRRSVLTVLAIIVSVAMVTAVFTSVFSFIKFMQDSTKAYDGNWHAQLFYDKLPDLTPFEKEDLDYCVGANAFNFRYDKEIDTNRAYAEVDAMEEAVVPIRNIHITEGTFPTKDGEILITQDYLDKNRLDWKVGDTVNLYCLDYDTGQESEKAYTLCGIAEANVSFFDHRDAIVAYTDAMKARDFSTYITVSFHTLDQSVYDRAEALFEETGAGGSVSYNVDLLNYSGVMKNNDTLKAIGGFVAVILAVIVIASVVMIYDSFAVSYQERERYLGMLASVGATKRQKRSSIYFEGLILGTIAIPIGILAGFAGMAITFKGIESTFMVTVNLPIQGTLKVHFNPYIILGAVLISALTIFISCYIPARRASKTTPINAIKGTNTVKVKKAKRLRVPKLTRKLYGFEGELAVKNFKRNGRRSRNIVFALVMSVVLFLAVTNFSQLFTATVSSEIGEINPDFTLYTEPKNRDAAERYFDGADIDDYFGYLSATAQLENTEYLTADAKSAVFQSDKGTVNVLLFVMDNKNFDTYLKSIGEAVDGYHDATQPKAIIFNRLIDNTGNKPETKAAFNSDITGKTLSCYTEDYNTDTGQFDIQHPFAVTAGIVTDKEYSSPVFQPKYDGLPSLILSEDAIPALPMEDNQMFYFCIFAKDYKSVMQVADEYFGNAGLSFGMIDNTSQAQSINAILTVTKVFIYGFITLLTLIAIINIINSISNSMNERKTEFAMLKSVGVTPKGFKKMIYVESVRYGVKSLLWSVPISVGLHYLMYYALSRSEGIDIGFTPNPQFYLAAILAVFVIILLSLLYSADKIKDDNIIENLKQD